MTPATVSPTTVKHWRAFGADEWSHVKDGLVGMALGSLLPVGLFYGAFRLWSFSAAVLLVLTWSACFFAWHRWRTGTSDVFSATTFVFACTKAVAGLVSQNPVLYLAWPSLENLVYGITFLGSALLGHPVLGLYAQRLYPVPRLVRETPVFQRSFLLVSAAWFVGHALRGLLRLLLLAALPLEAFLVLDTVAGWPISLTLVGITAWYPLRKLRQAGLVVHAAPVAEAIERAIEKAVEDPAAGVP